MTETLAQLLHDRAEDVRFDPLDVDAITQAGTRTVRRRRWAGAGAAALAVATVAILATTPWSGSRPDSAPITPTPPVTGMSWASGGVLHPPGGDLEVGHDVTAYVPTEVGFVFVDPESEVFSVRDGKVHRVGHAGVPAGSPGWPYMVGDTDGSLAAWLDVDAFVVVDLTSGDVHEFPVHGVGTVMAVDGRTLYVVDERGVTAIDVDARSATQIGTVGDVLGFEDGRMAQRADNGNLFVTASGSGDRAPTGLARSKAGFDVHFSPDAQWLSLVTGHQDSYEVRVYDTDTGRRVDLPTGPGTVSAYEWLDEDSLVVLSLETPASHYRLLSCTVSEPACTVAVPDLGEGKADAAGGAGFALPIGAPFYSFPRG